MWLDSSLCSFNKIFVWFTVQSIYCQIVTLMFTVLVFFLKKHFCYIIWLQLKKETHWSSSVSHHNVLISLLMLIAPLTLCSWKLASMQHWPGVPRRQRCWEERGRAVRVSALPESCHGRLHHQDIWHQWTGQQASVWGDLGTGKTHPEN